MHYPAETSRKTIQKRVIAFGFLFTFLYFVLGLCLATAHHTQDAQRHSTRIKPSFLKEDCAAVQDVGGAVGSAISFLFVEDDAGRMARAVAVYDQIKEVKKAFDGIKLRELPAIMGQMASTITRDLYTDAEATLGWEPLTPSIDLQVVSYMSGVTTGFVGEQIMVALIPGGAVAKIAPVLRGVVLAVKNGTRYSLEAVEASSKAGSWVYRSIQKVAISAEEARDALHGVQKAKNATLPAGRINPVLAMSARLRTRPELFDEVLAIWEQWLPRPVTAQQVEALTRNYARLIELAPGPTDLSDASIKSWARFYGAIGTGPNSTKYTESVVKVFGGQSNFDKPGFDIVMKQLSDIGHDGFKLEAITSKRWRSPYSGLVFTDSGAEGHRISHVFTHTIVNYKPGSHSVFNCSRGKLLPLLDEAWINRPSTPSISIDGKDKFKIPMGRIIGTDSEDHIYIIVNQTTSEIVTAYPVKSNFIPN